jgi:putative FmdB family regulatory protein
MPIYEFKCNACQKRFESLVRLGKEAEVVCEFCGSREVRKLLSAFGIGGGSSRIKASSGCSSCAGGTCSTCH